MSGDLSTLSPQRASNVLLTTQLREALQDAATAEANEAATNEAAAREQLRARLEPLIAARRRVLEGALALARADASASIDAAHRAAAAMIASASASASASAPAPEVIVAPVPPPPPVVTPVAPAAQSPVASAAPAAAFPPPQTPAVVTGSALALLPPGQGQSSPVNFVVDAEAFARVFATVLTSILNERFQAWSADLAPRTYVPQVPVAAPVAVPVPAKRSFWAHARHPDVLLLGSAMVIVLVVLVAWLG
ncbi:MAG: hypothetical protein F2789_11720 [Actinobacteria bacterium]|nr:hypothetical protein [Actinomycetota bacterium]